MLRLGGKMLPGVDQGALQSLIAIKPNKEWEKFSAVSGEAVQPVPLT